VGKTWGREKLSVPTEHEKIRRRGNHPKKIKKLAAEIRANGPHAEEREEMEKQWSTTKQREASRERRGGARRSIFTGLNRPDQWRKTAIKKNNTPNPKTLQTLRRRVVFQE